MWVVSEPDLEQTHRALPGPEPRVVASEHGCAHVFGRSQRAQARLIIDHAAHPDARDELHESLAARRPDTPTVVAEH
jgi:acyl-CoA hydrolase